MFDVIFPVIITLLVVFLLTVTSRNKDKVDKGVKFNYFRLSYRRKMIRTLIISPVIVLLFFVMYYFTDWSMKTIVLLELLLFIIFIVQLIYNYTRWKKRET